MTTPNVPPPDYKSCSENPQYIGPAYANPPAYTNPAMSPTVYSNPAMPSAGYSNPAMPSAGYSNPMMPSTGYSNPAMSPADDLPSYTANNDTESATVDESDPTFGSSFSDKAIRRAFIRKVYLILMAQLILTVGIISLCIFVGAIRTWIQTNLWVYLTSYAIFICVYIVLICIKSVRRKYPGNIICLIVLTVAMSIVLGTISCFHSTNIVLMSMAVTAVVCFSISLFAMQTRIDFTVCSSLLFVLVMVVLMFGFSLIITQYALVKPLPVLTSVYAALIALVYALFLIFDTQLIMGGKKYELSPEEYIFGALALYIDIIDLFLLILSLFGGNSN